MAKEYKRHVEDAKKILGEKELNKILNANDTYVSEDAANSHASKRSWISINAGYAIHDYLEGDEKALLRNLLKMHLKFGKEFSDDFNYDNIEFAPKGLAKLVINKGVTVEEVADAVNVPVVKIAAMAKKKVSRMPIAKRRRKRKRERSGGYHDSYGTPNKAKSREFAGRLLNRSRPAECALIMPSQNLCDVVQLFEVGTIDENTQLIFIERDSKIIKGWKTRGGGSVVRGIWRQKRATAAEMKLEQPRFKKDPLVYNGELHELNTNDPVWGHLDGKIDYVWLDLTGALQPVIVDWVIRTLSRKLSKWSNVNVTLKNEWRSNSKTGYEAMWQCKKMLEKFYNDFGAAYLEPLMEELDTDGEMKNFRPVTDNIILGAALTVGQLRWGKNPIEFHPVLRPSECNSQNQTELFGKEDIHQYKKSSECQGMAVHKFGVVGSNSMLLAHEDPRHAETSAQFVARAWEEVSNQVPYQLIILALLEDATEQTGKSTEVRSKVVRWLYNPKSWKSNQRQ